MIKGVAVALSICGVVACTASNEESLRIAVTESNELQVTELEYRHFDERGVEVHQLSGLRANGERVASVRLAIGIKDDAASAEYGADFGSELVARVAGKEERMLLVTRPEYEVDIVDDSIESFAKLPTVAGVLADKVNLIVGQPAPSAEVPYANNCNGSTLNNAPQAWQCCETGGMQSFIAGTSGPQAAQYDVVHRIQGPGACRTANNQPCTGGPSTCEYGPNGWKVTGITRKPAGAFFRMRAVQQWIDLPPEFGGGFYYETCEAEQVGYASAPSDVFAQAFGSFPRGQGCCWGTPTSQPYCCNGQPTSNPSCETWYCDWWGCFPYTYNSEVSGAALPGGGSGWGAHDY